MINYELKRNITHAYPAIAKALARAGRENPGQPLSFHFGLDVELRSAAVSVLIDGGETHYFNKRGRDEVVELSRHLCAAGHHVVAAQESCGFGPYFHRDLLESGATSYLVAPANLCGRRKTDKADAGEYAQRSFDYEANGNTKALKPILDIGDAKREFRMLARHREQLQKARNQLAGNGRGMMYEFGGEEAPPGWWGARKWPKLRAVLQAQNPWLARMLDPLQGAIQGLHARVRALEKEILESQERADTAQVLPKGLGEVTAQIIYGEVADWGRFRNRRGAGSFTGLCSGERSSGTGRRQGGIDRRGSRRLRKQLVEAVWRMWSWNKGWRAFKKFPHVFGGKAGPATRKKAIVACARMLMIDLWRLNTGQTTLENLGLLEQLPQAAP